MERYLLAHNYVDTKMTKMFCFLISKSNTYFANMCGICSPQGILSINIVLLLGYCSGHYSCKVFLFGIHACIHMS